MNYELGAQERKRAAAVADGPVCNLILVWLPLPDKAAAGAAKSNTGRSKEIQLNDLLGQSFWE